MPTITAKYRGTRQNLLQMLQSLPGILSGHLPDPTGLVAEVHRRAALALMRKLHESYRVRSTGGSDPDGLPDWPALAPYTVRKKGHAKILIDTQQLFDSLNPDTMTGHTILNLLASAIEVGSNRSGDDGVPLLTKHARGGPRLPQRRLIPEKVPGSWKRAMAAEIIKAAMETGMLARLLQSRNP